MKKVRRNLTKEDILRETLSGRFDIIRLLGKGGMAHVYMAHEIALDRDVAIKVLQRNLSDDEQFIERFKREARISARLEHTNIVRIYQITEENRFCYMVMNYLPGELLSQIIENYGPLTVKDIIRRGNDICLALEYAHEHGVIHRDLKPGNIILDSDDRAVVLDFGIAQAARDSDLISQGIVTGTPDYMSPEQAWGRDMDHRSDIYGLGLVLYIMATATLPFGDSGEFDLMCRMVREAPEPPQNRNKNVPHWLNDIILTCLQPDPDERFAQVSEIRLMLNEHTYPVFAGKGKSQVSLSADVHHGKEAVIFSLVKNKMHFPTDSVGAGFDPSWKPFRREDIEARKLDEFSSYIDRIPALPVHVHELLTGLSNDEVEAEKVVDIVSSDPAIVCNILKLVNSTYYGLERKTENLRYAIFFLGLNMIRKIALKTSFSKIYNADWSYRGYTTRGLWEHSYLVSSCAESLVKSDDSDYSGTVPILGILHDIGKYVFFKIVIDMKKKGKKPASGDKHSDNMTFIEKEETLFSINHTILGSLLAEKWGLSERICGVIEYHHHPSFRSIEMIPEAFVKDAVVICLSDLIVNSITRKHAILPEPAQEYFKIIDLKPPLENVLNDELLMDLAQARMFTALIS